MSTFLLIAGYALAVPPLFVLRRVWRERIWWGYAAETLGATLITVGWAMRGNTGAVIVNVSWALLFGAAFPLWHLVLRRGARATD